MRRGLCGCGCFRSSGSSTGPWERMKENRTGWRCAARAPLCAEFRGCVGAAVKLGGRGSARRVARAVWTGWGSLVKKQVQRSWFLCGRDNV